MDRVSVNGLLKPTDNSAVTDEYLGHFLKVSYIQEIGGNAVYSKDRVNVAENGMFRFFIPSANFLSGQSVTIFVYAPDGELLGSQIYSYGSLHAAEIEENEPDDTQPLEIEVDPKIIEFNDTNPIEESFYKISGRLVDISGEQNAAGVQLVIMAGDDANADPGSESFHAVFSARTDAAGHFFGRLMNKTYKKAYALVAGLEEQVIMIGLEDKKVPAELLLVADLSELPEEMTMPTGVANLPDGTELVRNPSYSQDIGGKCVDFTIPNRTLEEYSFYHTVRTTEPEIKGLTITAAETKNIKGELLDISDNLFSVFGRLKDSLNTLEVVAYTVDDEKTAEYIKEMPAKEAVSERDFATNPVYMSPVYFLKVASGTTQLKLSTRDLALEKKGIDFGSVVTMLAEQQKRKAKLQELHRKLAAAYCGKTGLQDSNSYCESLVLEDALNRQALNSLLGHIKKYEAFVASNPKLAKLFKAYLADMDKMIDQPFVDAGLINVMKTRAQKLIQEIDLNTDETQDQEELLGYLRRLVVELEDAANAAYTFEPCPPPKKVDTMGILCLIQEFDKTRALLRNKAVFTLGEILMIRANYDVYVTSISSFLSLLEQFHSFYTSGSNLLVSLEDDYFVRHYNQVRSSLTTLKRQIYLAIRKIEDIERAYISNHPGRRDLTVESGVDWDETPTIYENTTIAHGHILHFKQVWKADGYSLGDLLYSLPLAPCQEKQIAIIDWDREERAARTEAQTVAESLAADISRDRDISEIIKSSFRENISASSTNKTSGTSAGIGGGIFGAIGGLFGGVSHSGASSRSTANQNAARNLSGSTLNRLQDNISQSASSLRTQRSTAIQTVGQNETMTVQTEVVKNNNHCHAITIEYFEVLKHYAIEQKLVDCQECLFVPLPMSHFDYAKVLRWKNTLRRVVFGPLLTRGFDAIERITNNYADSDFPDGSYADETIEDFHGNFTITFDLKRPYISAIDEATKTETIDLSQSFPWFYGAMKFSLERPLTEAEKDALFEAEYVPQIVRSFIDTLEIYGIAEDGSEVQLDLDLTLLSNYRRNAPLQVSIASRTIPAVTRRQIRHLRFRAATSVKPESKIILRSVYLYYRTAHLNEAIIRNSRVNNDIINSVEVQVNFPVIQIIVKTDAALMYTPMSAQELRNPRKEDREAATALVSFLNEHMELAHKAIWSGMDASRLFGLLDGYIAPNSGGRSVASVVENKIMGVVGNNLVLKVVPGERLDPVFKDVLDLLAYYQPTTAPDPFRISVPTKGVYAESVMGKCNSCEEIDETRHWRFTEVPCGTQATSIQPVSTESRQSDVGDLQVKDLPSSIINMQTAPAAPDPTGLTAAFNLLGQSGVFKDMTGLAGTQANAAKAIETTSRSVTELAGMAADLRKQEAMKKDIGKTMKTIQDAEDKKQISAEQANELRMRALGSVVGEPTKKEPKPTSTDEVKELTKTAGDHKAAVKVNKPSGEQVEIDAKMPDAAAAAVTISLSGASGSAENRAFNPSSNDISGVIELQAIIGNAPAGASYRWLADNPAAVDIVSPASAKTQVKGKIPGKTGLTLEVHDSAGNLVKNMHVNISVPQFVTIDEDAATFDPILQSYQIDSVKDAVINMARETCDLLLNKANVRTVWRLGAFAEIVPAHIPAANITTAVFRGDPPTPNLLGVTHGPGGPAVLNETIDIYPGGYDDPIPAGATNIDVDVETQALTIELMAANVADPDLLKLAIKVFGRLFGETLAHEIVHSLLWTVIPSGHNSPSIANDLMNMGSERNFTQRTGIEDTSHTSPVDPDNFIDHGLSAIGGLQATNQTRIDGLFPVPPALS